MKGTHESLLIDAIYVLQELLEGITYQEYLLGLCCPLPLCIHGNSCLVGQLPAINQSQNQILIMIIAMHICKFCRIE